MALAESLKQRLSDVERLLGIDGSSSGESDTPTGSLDLLPMKKRLVEELKLGFINQVPVEQLQRLRDSYREVGWRGMVGIQPTATNPLQIRTPTSPPVTSSGPSTSLPSLCRGVQRCSSRSNAARTWFSAPPASMRPSNSPANWMMQERE